MGGAGGRRRSLAKMERNVKGAHGERKPPPPRSQIHCKVPKKISCGVSSLSVCMSVCACVCMCCAHHCCTILFLIVCTDSESVDCLLRNKEDCGGFRTKKNEKEGKSSVDFACHLQRGAQLTQAINDGRAQKCRPDNNPSAAVSSQS